MCHVSARFRRLVRCAGFHVILTAVFGVLVGWQCGLVFTGEPIEEISDTFTAVTDEARWYVKPHPGPVARAVVAPPSDTPTAR